MLFSPFLETLSVNTHHEPSRALGAACIAMACAVGSCPLYAAIACAINSQKLDFADYRTFNTSPTDGNGTVEVNCTNLDVSAAGPSALVLGIGPSSHGVAADRKMAPMSGQVDLLRYGIYRDAGRSVNWDQGNNAQVLRLEGLQALQTKTFSFTLFGRIPPLQNVRPGTYQDALTLTISP
jgi:spore coat protein U-like protein